MLIDFCEIEYKSGYDFERFVEDLLEALGWTIIVKSGKGPDGGRDIIASNFEILPTGKKKSLKYIVQCKHNAHSGKTLLPKDIPEFSIMPAKHKTQGWLLVTSTNVSQNVVTNLDAAGKANPKYYYDCWDSRKIEEFILNDKCRQVLKRYLPKSYAKSENIIAPAFSDVKELVNEWPQLYKDFSDLFFIDSKMEDLVYSLVLSERISLRAIKELFYSKKLVQQFIKIWKGRLMKGSVPGGIILLFEGLKSLNELNKKKLPEIAIETILASEISLMAFHRNVKRKYWKDFIIYRGQDYEWKSFELQQGQGFVPSGIPLSGLKIICYCENHGEAASGKIKLNGEQELDLFTSFGLESILEIKKYPLNLPFSIEYKLDKGSDTVLFLSVGYAPFTGVTKEGFSAVTWRDLA